jgi:hypothetical protein
MHIAMLKITSGSCKVEEMHIASSKLPWILAKLKKCTLQAQIYLGFLQSSRNEHCKLEITSSSCKAQEMHIACLKLRSLLQSSRNSCLIHTWVQLRTKVV